MALIYTDSNREDIDYVQKHWNIDFDIGLYNGGDNDFEITVPSEEWTDRFNDYSIVYDEDGGELGGLVKGKTSDTAQENVIIWGLTWRGIIKQDYIEPPDGQAYYEARGDANSFLRDVLDNYFDGLIVGSEELCGVNVNYDIRYINKLEAIEKTLEKSNLKMKITFIGGCAVVSAVDMISDIDVELSNDYGYDIMAKDLKNGINHVICLGQGELTERTIVHLYLLSNGTITQDKEQATADGIYGLYETKTIYDNSNAQDISELIEGGSDKLISNEKSLTINNVTGVDIGDVVNARDYITGIFMTKKIVAKVFSGCLDNLKIENKVGD